MWCNCAIVSISVRYSCGLSFCLGRFRIDILANLNIVFYKRVLLQTRYRSFQWRSSFQVFENFCFVSDVTEQLESFLYLGIQILILIALRFL